MLLSQLCPLTSPLLIDAPSALLPVTRRRRLTTAPCKFELAVQYKIRVWQVVPAYAETQDPGRRGV